MRILKVLCLALALMLCGAALAEGAPTPAEVGAEGLQPDGTVQICFDTFEQLGRVEL